MDSQLRNLLVILAASLLEYAKNPPEWSERDEVLVHEMKGFISELQKGA